MKKTFMLLALCLGVLAAAAPSPKLWAQQPSPQRVEITAKRYSFSPGEITVKKGQPVVLVLKSADVAHGLRIRELKLNVKVQAGSSTQVEFTPDKVGDFIGHCSVFCGSGHGSMTIKLHVVA
ncbi:MAG TPA: cupredoxin domain-containing protein [Silvibacterium sp.]|nr:cupredoxin domain-containing protein [Silvibacterium sp.]